MKINVVNKYTHIKTEKDFYIGRPNPLSNIFSHLDVKGTIKVENRELAVSEYEKYIRKKIEQKDEKIINQLNFLYKKLLTLKEINLVCFCSPKKCHGDIVKKILLEKYQERNGK